MKKALCVFLAVLLLLAPMGCGERKEPVPTGTAEVETLMPSPTLTPTLTPTLPTTSTPTHTPTPILTPDPSPESVPVDAALTDEQWLTQVRDCLKRAQKVMAPFMAGAMKSGTAISDSEGHIWRQLDGYANSKQMKEDLLGAFSEEIVEQIWVSVKPFLWDRADGLYLREDAADVLNWNYTVDVSQVRSAEVDDAFLAYGTKFGLAAFWRFWLDTSGATPVIGFWWAVEEEFGVQLGDVWYTNLSTGSPPGLGEPICTEESSNQDPDYDRFYTEYYDGLSVVFWWANEEYHPLQIIVTKQGFPVSSGIEVGDTWEKVTALYRDAPAPPGPKDILSISDGWDSGSQMQLTFDNTGILSEIHIVYTFG